MSAKHYSKTDVRDQWGSRVGDSPDCSVDHSNRQLYGKGREASILDVNAGYIHCTNNQYK